MSNNKKGFNMGAMHCMNPPYKEDKNTKKADDWDNLQNSGNRCYSSANKYDNKPVTEIKPQKNWRETEMASDNITDIESRELRKTKQKWQWSEKKTNSWKTKANCFSQTKEWNKKPRNYQRLGGGDILVTKQKI